MGDIMLKRIAALVIILGVPASALAHENGPFGLGVQLGEPSGVSGKLWLNRTTAVDGVVAWSFASDGAVHLQGDYLVHDFNLIDVDKGSLPSGDVEAGYSGYDTTLDGTFLTTLLTTGYLREPLRDPINDATYHYRYQRYAAGTSGFTTDFYVIGIMKFETSGYTNVRGYWKGTDKDWTADFAYCTGGVPR